MPQVEFHTVAAAPAKSRNPVIRLASGPGRAGGNPYLKLFYKSLSENGIELVGPLTMTRAWLDCCAKDLDGLHFHWPEKFWRKTPQALLNLTRGRAVRRLRPVTRMLGERLQLLRLRWYLRRARELGVRLVWTLHNLEPHEGASKIDERGYGLLARHCDLILCHSESAREQCIARYHPRATVVVMRHGNYDGAYPDPRPRGEVLDELGLDEDRPVVGCVGRMRIYKGLDLACAAVARCEGVQLLVAGSVQKGFELAGLQRDINSLGRGVLVARAVSDQEFSDYTAACDAMLLPYRKVTGSGACLASWTLGRGVVASDLPYFREMLGNHPKAGRIFRTEDAASLAAGITAYLAVPAAERNAAARAAAEYYAWDRCVRPVAEVLHRWNGIGRSTSR
jgi:beta-1,4-mannosyltransferase